MKIKYLYRGFEEILWEIDCEKVFEIINEWRDSTRDFPSDALDIDYYG